MDNKVPGSSKPLHEVVRDALTQESTPEEVQQAKDLLAQLRNRPLTPSSTPVQGSISFPLRRAASSPDGQQDKMPDS